MLRMTLEVVVGLWISSALIAVWVGCEVRRSGLTSEHPPSALNAGQSEAEAATAHAGDGSGGRGADPAGVLPRLLTE
jgi:hypothetical protein